MDLIIVESPHKAKTIEKFLSSKYKVDASKGHVRDLPLRRLGVSLETFEPNYEINPDKKADIERLITKASKADKIYLATDPDREGEAISWHLAEVLKLSKDKYRRIEFNEISEKAVKNALANPRDINYDLVDAQQARRVLDRLVGYKISPVVDARVKYENQNEFNIEKNLSAGRVQSVALRLVVEREREIKEFKPQEYWNIKANLEAKDGASFKALLQEKNGKKYKPKNAEEVEEVVNELNDADFIVKTVKKSVVKSHALPPFITSTLQQDGSNKLGITAPQVMQIAQRLYEGVETPNGHLALITYMRTDSVRISKEAQNDALNYIKENFGEEYCPSKPNVYKSKKGAQDAHEAIRPVDINRTPESLKNVLDRNQYRLYKMIFERFIASQMADAKYNSVNVDVEANGYLFKASGKTLVFKGYTAVYQDYQHKDNDDEDESSLLLPPLTEGDKLKLLALLKEQKFTKPPQRFTEATLIKSMEDKGIGRPSTYASIMAKLTESGREYLRKEGKYLIPNDISYPIVDFLVKYFPDIMTVSFTARMETALDEIEEGGKDWKQLVSAFYYPFEKRLYQSQYTDRICEKCGSRMLLQSGKFGTFFRCSAFPDCKNIISAHNNQEVPTNEICDKCGAPMVEKESEYGKFYACSNYPKCKFTRNINEKISEKKCPNCGGDMVERKGVFGPYLACKNCKTTISIQQNVGICPNCGKPTKAIITKTKKVFYGCTNYPECDFKSWDIPTGERCQVCGSYLVKVDDVVKCANKSCKTNIVEKNKVNV